MKVSLNQYLNTHKISLHDFAEQIGYAPQYVRSVRNWKLQPGKKFMRDVAIATEDKVSFDKSLMIEDRLKTLYFECPCCKAQIPKNMVPKDTNPKKRIFLEPTDLLDKKKEVEEFNGDQNNE